MRREELRKLKRVELLEILLNLSEENEKLNKEIVILKQELDLREIKIKESGSIAEAALKLNGIFEAADKAVEQYIENVKIMINSKK